MWNSEPANMTDHNHELAALRDDGDVDEIEVDEKSSKELKINWTHSPLKSLNLQKTRAQHDKIKGGR